MELQMETEGLWYVYSTYFFLDLLWFLISPTLVTVERLRNRKTHHNISIPGYYPDIQTKINIFFNNYLSKNVTALCSLTLV